LNDASELVEPLHIAEALLTVLARQIELANQKDKEIKLKVIRRMCDDINEWEQINICVASFCAKGDLLSQWRGYGVPGLAYSIGFDREKLAKSIEEHPFELRPCQYFDSEKYRQKIEQFILETFNEAVTSNTIPEDFIGKFIRMAATIKLKCFEEEDEWRIVSWKPASFTDDRFKFRPGKSMIIPYYSLPLDVTSIVEIVIGPCQYPVLAQSAIGGLVHKFKLENIKPGKVKVSQIPYRNI
jgi:hypothetical protein